MATKKISELEAITEADGSDALVIVDVSEGKTNKITKNNLLQGAGHTIEMSLNQETYALTLTLKNAEGTELSTASIDLPNENAITNISYSNGALTLTKQSGVTSTVDISGLINGLATETALTNLANALKETIGIQTNTYNESQTYNTGDIVVQNEKIYKCKEDNITGTFDSSKWDEISLYEYQKLQDEAIEENYKVITKLQEDVEDLTERMEDAENNEMTYTPTPATSHYLQDSADSRFRKFIPIGRTTQSNLPEGYTQLDYITSDGNAFIDTGIILGKNYKVDVKFVNNVSGNEEQPIVSIWTTSTNWWNLFINSSGVLDFYAKGHNYLDEVTIGEKQNINIIRDENNTTVIKNGQSFTIPVSYNETNNTTLKILKRGDNQGNSRASILSVNVYNDNILVGNFVPCKDVSNKIGLYDLVTKTFFANAGTGTFMAGDVSVPTPETPIPIKNTGDNGFVNENVQNKNLFKIEEFIEAMTKVGLRVTEIEYNKKTCYEIRSGSNYRGLCELDFEENIQYAIQLMMATSQADYYFRWKYSDGTLGDLESAVNLPNFTKVTSISSANKTIVGFQFDLYNGTRLYFQKDTIQIEQGPTATSYVPHSEQNISFPLAEGQKFYEGSHPDYDEKVHHKMGEKTLDGTEDWQQNSTYNNVYVLENFLEDASTKEPREMLSTHFIYGGLITQGSSSVQIGKFYQWTTIPKRLILGYNSTSLNDFKTFLAQQYANGTPVKVVYELAEEQTEDFTSEQQTAWEQIKKARTYKNITHISSEDETPANVEIEYVVDINTIDDRITALEARVDLLEE